MKNKKKLVQSVSVFLAIVLFVQIVCASSVIGFLLYSDTTSSYLTIEYGEDVAIEIGAYSVLENSMTIDVDLINSDSVKIADLLYRSPVSGSYSESYSFGESIYKTPGTYIIRLTITGASGQIDVDELSLTVNDQQNTPPVINSNPITETNEKETYSYQIVASDADGDVLTHSLSSNSPSWLSIDTTTGLITGTAPEVTENTSYDIGVVVSDGKDSVRQDYAILVINILILENNPPVINSNPSTEVNEKETYSYQIIASDSDDNILSYSLSISPSWLSINTQTGLITGTSPEVTENTSYYISIIVSDGTDIDTQSYTLLVADVPIQQNNLPVISSTPTTEINETETYSYQIVASDADGDVLTHSLSNSPSWLSIDATTGLITGTAPEVTETTSYDVSIIVSDGIDTTTQDYTLLVFDTDADTTSPVITIISPENKTYDISDILFEISTDEDAEAWFSLNGQENISLDSYDHRLFNKTLELSDSDYEVIFYVNDSSGNIASANVSFNVDTSDNDNDDDDNGNDDENGESKKIYKSVNLFADKSKATNVSYDIMPKILNLEQKQSQTKTSYTILVLVILNLAVILLIILVIAKLKRKKV